MNNGYLHITWIAEGHDRDGNTTYYCEKPNLVVNTGKEEVLKFVGGITTASASGFIFLGYGASAITPDVTHSKLGGTSGHEYIGATIRQTITDFAISAETYVYSGLTFTEKLVGSTTIGPSNPNGTVSGVPINMAGLFNTYTLPATVGGTSGIMLNEVELSDTFTLFDDNSLTLTVVVRQ